MISDGSSGRPITTGSVTNSEGNVLASVHATRLERLAETATGRTRAHLLAAAEAIRLMAKKNKRLGGMVGGVMKRGLLNYRGISLTGQPDDIAETIADLCSRQRVTVYRWRDKRKIRVVAGGQVPTNGRLIGTYDEGADNRTILGDLRLPDEGPKMRAMKKDPQKLRALAEEFSVGRSEAKRMMEA